VRNQALDSVSIGKTAIKNATTKHIMKTNAEIFYDAMSISMLSVITLRDYASRRFADWDWLEMQYGLNNERDKMRWLEVIARAEDLLSDWPWGQWSPTI
jgi:hypothetical protein